MLTDLNYIQPGATWPPPSESERLDKYRANRRLFDGKHDAVFRQAVERRLFREETQEIVYLILNYHKRLSTHWADLLFTEEPVLTAGDPESQEQETLERLNWDSDVTSQVGPEAVIDMSRYGDGLLKVFLEDGRGRIESLSPTYWFPVGSETNNRRISAHVLAWEFERGEGNNKRRYVRFEIHERGRITHRVFRLKHRANLSLIGKAGPNDQVLGDELPAATFDESLRERVNTLGVEETGVDEFLIVPAPNLRTSDDYHGRDDYTDLESIVSELEVRISQIARILDRHSDPNMYGDDSALEQDEETGRWTFKGGGKFFPVPEGGTPPGYVTWDGQLQAAYSQIDTLIEQFWMIAETSPSAFGLSDKEGRVTSGFQFRLSLIAALNKVARLRKSIGPALRFAFELAARLEAANGQQALEIEPEITWRDGIPSDPKEEAETQAVLVGAGLRSKLTAIKQLNDFTTDEQAQEELDRIMEEQAESAGATAGASPPASLLGTLRQRLSETAEA
jgi:hypothetical protein